MANQKYSLDDLIKKAGEAKSWDYGLVVGAYQAYESRITSDNSINSLTIAHFGIERGSSNYENSSKWYNVVRNELLHRLPIFGKRNEIRFHVWERDSERKDYNQTVFTQDPRAIELYKRIHAENNKGPYPRPTLML